MASDQFYLFAALASFNRSVQEQLRAVHSPQEIVDLAAEKGYSITIEQLARYAGSLTSPHWIWFGHDEPWRNEFFAVEHG